MRAIVHLDADAFFASVEQAADAHLRGKPIAVGGEKRGIIASASYEARKFGIYTPMPTIQARRLCPKLILLPGDFEKYELFSRLMFSYAYDFTPDVEIGSIDEGYFDLTGVRKPAVGIAETIRNAIRQKLRLSVSEGIAANKLVSQIASKLKKPSAFEFVPPGNEAQFLSPLANKWLPGIGPKTAGQLNAAGLAHIGQIAQTPVDLLGLLVGRQAPQLHRFAAGIDERSVIPVRAPAKSYGEQETFAADTTDEDFLEATLRRMADKLMAKVRDDAKSIRTLTVKVRYNDMDEEQASESLPEPTDLETDLYSKISALLRKAWRRRVSLRLVSLKLSNVYDGRFCCHLALDASTRRHVAQQRLADAVDGLRQKYGRPALLRGHDFVLRTKDGRGEEPAIRSQKSEVRRSEARGLKPQVQPRRGAIFVVSRALDAISSPVEAQCSHTNQTSHQNTTGSSQLPYHLAVLRRQRIGNSFTRAPEPPQLKVQNQKSKIHSPAPELRFRITIHPPATTTQHAPAAPERQRSEPRNTHPPSSIQYPASSIRHLSSCSTLHAPRSTFPIPLNVHSYYSFLNSTLSIKAIFALAQHYELPAIALTDQHNLHGAVEFAQAAAEAGIKPIIGAELNCQGHRLCLYVQNQTGYHNLCRILSQSKVQSPKSKVTEPQRRDRRREDNQNEISAPFASLRFNSPHSIPQENQRLFVKRTATLFDFGPWTLDFGLSEGLLAVSPCPDFASFFPDRFYLEINSLDAYEKHLSTIQHPSSLTPHPTTPPLHHSITPHSALPLVASFPVHYALPADRWKYDIVQSIRTLTLLRQPHPEKRLDGEYHFRPPAEMQHLFAAHPELLAHSLEIADRCNFTPLAPERGCPEHGCPSRSTSDGNEAEKKFEDAGSIETAAAGTAALRGAGDMPPLKPQFPAYPTPDGSPPAVFLRRLVMDGLRRRYPNDHARLKPQLEQELAIITDVGYEEYFLVMWDILQECRRRGIEWITRGSAADSLACYCLEISGVCPIRFDLYFRRFLNKDRMALNKLPDIDVDFPHDRKDDVIDLIFEKYGSSRAAVVGGFSTFQSRSAFAEVAKVLGVSEYQVRRLTERLPHFSRPSDLSEAVARSLECRDLPLDQEPYSTALAMAQFLDGFPRYAKMHPCGVVLSRQPIHEITPTFISAKGYPTTHFDMDSVEAVGLVKMDILAQGGLAVMRDVLEEVQSPNSKVQSQSPVQNSLSTVHSPRPELQPAVRNQSGFSLSSFGGEGRGEEAPNRSHCLEPGLDMGVRKDFRISDFPSTAGPFNDPRIWNLISSGQARAVHHIESPAMISLCKMCNVRDIDTLIAIVSVIRPGAANESKKMEFARRYQRLSPIHYPHPSLEPCLHSTFGLVVYEEHILQICEAFAGLPPGRADVLRRALGKDKTDIIAQIQTEFADCARKLGRTEAEIAEVWELVNGFRGYAFCKAHSTAYGVEAYQSAWLKLHYPAHFMAAVLTNGKGFYSPLVYVLECHRLGIPLLPPSINEPGPQFKVVRPEQDRGIKSEIRNPKSETNSNKEISNSQNSQLREALAKSQAPTGTASQIPLTPTLSQRERENRRQMVCETHSFCTGLNCLSLLPLPLGEGWGEGDLDQNSLSCTNNKVLNISHSNFGFVSDFGFRNSEFSIRVPLLLVKGLTLCTKDAILRERARAPFSSLADFFLRVQPLPEEMEALIRVGAFDPFGQPRTVQYWEFKSLCQTDLKSEIRNPKPETNSKAENSNAQNSNAAGALSISNSNFGFVSDFGFRISDLAPPRPHQLLLFPPISRFPSTPLTEPTHLDRLRAEEELLGYPVSGHPLELFPDIAWDTYCPINRLGEHLGQQIVTCGLVIEQRLFHQATGEPMKFITIADWTGIIETELFARTYRSYGLSTIRYRVLEITATVEPFDNTRGHTLRVLRAGKPRTKK